MQKQQKGFTLIELVVVIVLLGILGVTALAKFQNLSLAARNASIQGVASEITGGSSINYAASLTGLATAVDTSDETQCAAIAPLLMTGGLPAGYTAAAGAGACTAAGDTFTCTIDHSDAGTTAAAATIICSGP